MPTINSIRFQKIDKYSAIFICNEKSESDAYNKLKKYYTQLHEQYPDKFLPIFHSDTHKYSTIRFKLTDVFNKLHSNDVVSLNFKIKRSASTKKTIYCQLTDLNVISQATLDDELDLD